jgi:hypothetical protein
MIYSVNRPPHKGGVTYDLYVKLAKAGLIDRDRDSVRMDERGEVTIRPRTIKMWETEDVDQPGKSVEDGDREGA